MIPDSLISCIYHHFNVQNFLFTTRDEDAPLKIIDFGLSDFIRTGNGPSPMTSFLATLVIL